MSHKPHALPTVPGAVEPSGGGGTVRGRTGSPPESLIRRSAIPSAVLLILLHPPVLLLRHPLHVRFSMEHTEEMRHNANPPPKEDEDEPRERPWPPGNPPDGDEKEVHPHIDPQMRVNLCLFLRGLPCDLSQLFIGRHAVHVIEGS